ncbi:MAG: MerR family transcriptional regulator [Dietzia sp.]
MHSGELARLAGVTVRTLRHYHKVGVLAEPGRRSNGYREYTVHDLIRVLRIRRLASLGIALDTMGDLLDGTGGTAGDLLDKLDEELAGQIDHLTGQRELISRLREHDVAPDLPPELAPFLAVFAGAGVSPDLARYDREQSILIAHLAGEDGVAHIIRLYQLLSDPEVAPTVQSVNQQFDKLGPHTADEEIDELIDSFMSVVVPVMFAGDTGFDPEVDHELLTAFVTEYSDDLLNEQQRRTLDKLGNRLSHYIENRDTS